MPGRLQSITNVAEPDGQKAVDPLLHEMIGA
jgi:hypothetical protein